MQPAPGANIWGAAKSFNQMIERRPYSFMFCNNMQALFSDLLWES